MTRGGWVPAGVIVALIGPAVAALPCGAPDRVQYLMGLGPLLTGVLAVPAVAFGLRSRHGGARWGLGALLAPWIAAGDFSVTVAMFLSRCEG